MENKVQTLIKYVLLKLEKEPISKRIQMYRIIANFIPDECYSQQFHLLADKLRKIDDEIKAARNLFNND